MCIYIYIYISLYIYIYMCIYIYIYIPLRPIYYSYFKYSFSLKCETELFERLN